MHKPEEIYNSSDIQNDTLPQRKLLKHLSVAQHLFLLCFCCSDFVYSSLSQSSSFILSCLNLFLTTVIPSTQKNERNSQWKTQSFHLGHESITRAVFLNTLHVVFFCPRAFRGSSSGLKGGMYWLWHVYFHGKDMLCFQQDQHIWLLLFMCLLEYSQ